MYIVLANKVHDIVYKIQSLSIKYPRHSSLLGIRQVGYLVSLTVKYDTWSHGALGAHHAGDFQNSNESL